MSIYIKEASHYKPKHEVPNSFFKAVNGLDEEWIFQRTGINTRLKANDGENTNTMAIAAVKNLTHNLDGVDLIVGASYSPFDTVATIAHVVQQEFSLNGAKAVYISSACSSLINAIEIVEGYFAMNKATKALVVASEHNWAYSDPSDEKSGHLWGDGAAALLLSKEGTESDPKILNVYTEGLGDIGQGPKAVYLQPGRKGLVMPNGRDVFINACEYMERGLVKVLEETTMAKTDIDYIIPHQANNRIISNLAARLSFDETKICKNIDKYGNTGCASTAICLSEHWSMFEKGALVGVTVFGGGYSCGAMLIQF